MLRRWSIIGAGIVVLVYILSNFLGFGGGGSGIGNTGTSSDSAAEPASNGDSTNISANYVFEVPEDNRILHNGEEIDLERLAALVNEAGQANEEVEFELSEAVSVAFANQLKAICNEAGVDYSGL